ncbi:MAG TPA: Rieske 2Fe-2S domain-containing protein [Dehalococcoidia bacterium]|nr:Rieske 2Fe-2S domain-containing protein [Dehalococcoidia bacterium]
MLSKQDNDFLCKIGPGTPMGDLMRQYWLPAIRSDELPAPDCAPLRVMLLGEQLIAFRATSGKVGLMQNACPHRGASLFFGRNEEEGLRCVYHGWKYDTTGACTDMPSEPAESNFKTKVRARAYPTYERGGVIWAYMGPREVPPPLPQIEAFLMAQGAHQVSAIMRPCNWMQGWEGEMDTVHAAFLHFGASKPEEQAPNSFNFYQANQRHAKFSVVETDFGTSYGAYRPAEDDTYYWRIAHMLFPFYAMIPQGAIGKDAKIGAYVPMDDEHTMHWEIFINPSILGGPGVGSREQASDPRAAVARANGGGSDIDKFIDERQAQGASAPQGGPTATGNPSLAPMPNTTDWFGRFRLPQSLANDYMIDREAQRTWKSFTGIPGVRQQDMAVTESMGPVYKRYNEHLGTTDAMIIRTRRRMINAAKALRDEGVIPPGVDNPEVYHQRSGEVILPRDVFWWDATKPMREVFEVADLPREFVASGAR